MVIHLPEAIRESFMQCWEPNQVLDILAITNYRCTLNELKIYIKYTCANKGIKIRVLGSPAWSCPRDELTDIVVHDERLIDHHVVGSYQQWMNMIYNTRSPLTTIFDASSSNSEFSLYITLTATVRHNAANGGLSGSINIHSNIASKVKPQYYILDIQMNQESSVVLIPISDDSKIKLYSYIDKFSEFLTMSIHELKYFFLEELRYEYPAYGSGRNYYSGDLEWFDI